MSASHRNVHLDNACIASKRWPDRTSKAFSLLKFAYNFTYESLSTESGFVLTVTFAVSSLDKRVHIRKWRTFYKTNDIFAERFWTADSLVISLVLTPLYGQHLTCSHNMQDIYHVKVLKSRNCQKQKKSSLQTWKSSIKIKMKCWKNTT